MQLEGHKTETMELFLKKSMLRAPEKGGESVAEQESASRVTKHILPSSFASSS